MSEPASESMGTGVFANAADERQRGGGVREPILTLRSVVAGYGAGDILKGVDLDVDAGTVTCLIGPNGAGKST
ncbi:MAG TPA: ATP-binding cassette domain-containing protein, partial [Pseudonocardiaceae bacterium]|nr:ATP-binding cassette domain-containing protein [Pseudonocardiaceae bacterium]